MTISPQRGPKAMARVRRHGQVTPAVAGDVLVSVSVGPADEAIAVWAAPADRQALLAHDGAVRPSPARPAAVRVSTHGAGTDAVVAIAALDMAFFHAQPLPGGRVLMVAARGGTAVVFDAAGQPVHQGNLGDGIEHVRTTPAGQVWVGYFDEGVYGNDPVAHHGIVRFSDDLRPAWTYPFDSGFGPVDDCYALTIDGEAAWSCYYNSFSIVRLAGDAVTGWHNRHVHGATTLIVDRDVCALVGGYQTAPGRTAVGRLADGQFQPAGERLLSLPDGQPLPPGTRFASRGPDLHLFIDTTWYRLSLDDLR
ncbi:hypothetical protein [Dactylosporangium sp. CA-092794]|uniref:hypothetical protein n=1 Tax=Dactylosporangium sp. CA-092794 TaxID=3239929 RepID=UPI003D907AB5